MLIIKDISNLQKYLEAYRSTNKTLGYVPTMGALHDGHKALIDQSQKENNKTIDRIFVKIIMSILFLSQITRKSIPMKSNLSKINFTQVSYVICIAQGILMGW